MICQKCGKHQATVHLKQIINGVCHEEYLCPSCANGGNSFFTESFDVSADSLFEALFSGGRQTAQTAKVTCPLCGASLRDIQKSGKAGCAKCYEVFAVELKNAAYRIHGGVQHVGRAPGNHREAMERQAKLEQLRERQAKAIEEQDFELAAKLRDEIKELTEKKNTDNGAEKGGN